MIAIYILAWWLAGMVSIYLLNLGIDVDTGTKSECPTWGDIVICSLFSFASPIIAIFAIMVWITVGWKLLTMGVRSIKPSWWNKKICGD